MDIQKSAEFQTTKFYAKTNFNMAELKKEEEEYKLPQYQMKPIHPFKSPEERERILYENFLSVNADIQALVVEVQQFAVKQ